MLSRSFCLGTKNLNSFDNEDEEDDLLSKKDVERLTNLWKTMKDSKKHLNNSKTNINASFLNSNAPHHMNTSFNNHTMKQNDDSICDQFDNNSNNDISLNISKIPHIPKQTDTILLQKAKDSNKLLIKKVKDQEVELEQCHQKIAKLVSQNQTQTKQISELSQKLEQYAISQKEILEKSRLNTNMIEQSLEDKDRIMEDLKTQLQESKDQVQRMINSNKDIMNENSKLIEQLESKTVENERIKDRLQQVEKYLEEIYNEKQVNSVTQVEMDYLKSDIERLLKLLKSTQEYKELSFMAEESMSIRYLKSNPSFLKNYKLSNQNASSVDLKQSTIKRNCCGCSAQVKQQEVNEKQLWVPRDAFQFAFQISQKYNKRLTEEIIEELLFGLNQIWSNKEKTAVDKLKRQYETENKELKKQLNKNLTYDEVQAKKKIQRLKSELSKTRKENDFSTLNTTLPLPPSRGGSLNGNSHQCKQQEKIIYFQDAIRLFQEYESEIRIGKEELQEAKNKIRQIEEDASLYDKVIYMEGALWMIEKILADVNKVKQQSFNQLNQYQLDLDKLLLVSNNNTEEEVDINAVLKLTKNLVSALSHLNQSLNEKYHNLKDSTQKQIEKSSRAQHKLKKQRKTGTNNQQYNQENINSMSSLNKNAQSQYDEDYEKEQHINSAAISPISINNYKQYHSYNAESNTTTQRVVAQNLIPQVYNSNSVYSSNHNINNYVSEHNQNTHTNNKSSNNIDSLSHRQNNHYSTASTPLQQYQSSHSGQYNSRQKDIFEDSINQRPIQEKQNRNLIEQ
ncbi:hypothetical protein ABPG72_014527 [Tetrahymena utriculariae]